MLNEKLTCKPLNRLDSQDIIHQTFPKTLQMVFLTLDFRTVKKNQNILALKFECFPVLLFKEIHIVQKHGHNHPTLLYILTTLINKKQLDDF